MVRMSLILALKRKKDMNEERKNEQFFEEKKPNYALIGTINEFVVLRETNLGYMLSCFNNDASPREDEYFLHHNECCGMKLDYREHVKAFIYVDKLRRVAATLSMPKVTLTEASFCPVVGKSSSGVYINIGISKDVLFSSDAFAGAEWPIEGDLLLGVLKARNNSLFYKTLNKQEIIDLNQGNKLELGKKYDAFVYRVSESGLNLVTEDYNVIFVHKSHLRKTYRLGEKAEVKIVKVNDTDYSGSITEQKEIEILSDSEILLKYLNEHNGVMNYGGKTDPEIIMHVFHMGKASFKRALGKLYKDELVILDDKKTILKR